MTLGRSETEVACLLLLFSHRASSFLSGVLLSPKLSPFTDSALRTAVRRRDLSAPFSSLSVTLTIGVRQRDTAARYKLIIAVIQRGR